MDILQNMSNYLSSLSPNKISLIALSVSVISLFFSLLKVRLVASEKRTELMMKLLDVKIKFERCLRICQERAFVLRSDDCLEKWRKHIPRIEESINKVEKEYKTIEKFTGIWGPIQLEKIMPYVSGLLKKVEVVESGILDLEKMCLSCEEDRSKTCEKTPADIGK